MCSSDLHGPFYVLDKKRVVVRRPHYRRLLDRLVADGWRTVAKLEARYYISSNALVQLRLSASCERTGVLKTDTAKTRLRL